MTRDPSLRARHPSALWRASRRATFVLGPVLFEHWPELVPLVREHRARRLVRVGDVLAA